MGVIRSAGRLLTEEPTPWVLGAALVLSLVAAPRLAARLDTTRTWAFALLASTGLVLVGVLVVGRGTTLVTDATLDVAALRGCGTALRGGLDATAWTSAEAVLNLLLFVPLGLSATVVFGRPGAVAVALAGLAVVLEATQTLAGIGVCESVDVVRNVIGAGVGVALGMGAHGVRRALSR